MPAWARPSSVMLSIAWKRIEKEKRAMSSGDYGRGVVQMD
tara:strand:+ start:534 stop:653 length:120 start_codon:yes stop_codon:yes gene_type:complete